MNLSLKSRLIVCFGGLMALSVVAILLLTWRFVQERIAEDVANRLNDSANALVRVHTSAKADREARIINLSREPLIRSLSTIDDSPTLQDSASELREELRMHLIAFLTPAGEVLAWDGGGKDTYKGGAITKSASAVRPSSSYMLIGDEMMEVNLVPIEVAGEVNACLLAGTAFDSSVLDTYEAAVGCRIDLLENGRVLTVGGMAEIPPRFRASREVPVAGGVLFRLQLDTRAISGPLRHLLRSVATVGLVSVMFSIVGAWLIAGWVSQPIYRLGSVAESIRDGDLSVRAGSMGPPVVQRLSGTFNGMLDDLLASQKQLRDYASQLEDEVEERKRLEDALVHAQKMEAIGRLAGGVAHDFNNLLTIIMSNCQMALEDMDDDQQAREGIQDILEAGHRAAGLTRQLLVFSRRHAAQPVVLSLNDVVEETGKMIRRLIGEDIDLVIRLGSGLERVKIDRGQVEQVVINLAVNARDAMPRGGRLSIATENVVVDKGVSLELEGIREGAYVALVVADTGTGMDDETRHRIFEPFYTTKEAEKGTGLGLSTVYGIIKEADGGIRVGSQVGEGSTFHVYLPVTRDAVEPAAETSGQVSIREGTETILLVEDEEAVARLLSRWLTKYGYKVLEAGDPDEALEIESRYGETIHLVVTDVILPRMHGPSLVTRLRERRADIKVLYISGYSGEAVDQYEDLKLGDNLLAKPIEMPAFLIKVGELLTG